ncbi:SGNH/GDSL hydrolase family protein [Mucilaginibacter segetis]|uniref:SGNH/GDSL hydrolase family protein n=1 Tax=Mucilaginibacter segetis TaxID=2793071 RepID=A0A934PUW5_9SPHI|nr:SGNH/GDSL hydrolase family protein [Mucilaginibacter segetis]MBK0379571.1 SGNH/GDSL hydrolase family protein [Mucilaginibacter segetis]
MKRILPLFLFAILLGCKKGIVESEVKLDTDKLNADNLLSAEQKPLTVPGKAYFFGDSITEGYSGNAVIADNWVNNVSKFVGWDFENLGISGTTMVKNVNGADDPLSMYNRAIAEIPEKTTGDKYLFFAYGMNDVGKNVFDVTTAQFIQDYQYVINNALAKNWNPSDIILLNIYYCKDQGFTLYNVEPPATHFRQITFNQAIKNIALKNEVHFIDIYSFMKDNGADYLISYDGIHPNKNGYAVIARGVIEALRSYK